MNTNIFEEYESSVRSYCRLFPTTFNHAKDAIIFDSDGIAYIDFMSGAGALNYGHNNSYIKRAMIDYLESDGILHGLDMHTVAKQQFLECFQKHILLPRNMNYKIMFCGPTGTNSIEAALKLARKITNRHGVWSFMGGYHGVTLGSLSITTQKYARSCAGVELSNCTHIPAPYMFPGMHIVDYMQRLLDDDHSGVEKPAALIMETVQAEGGVYIFSNEFLQECRQFCTENGIILIVDEIQTGCARTGDFFSFERALIKPDIIAMSKSTGGIGMPISLLLIGENLDIWKPAEHNGTFRGNQLGFVAGKAAIEYLINEDLILKCKQKGKIVEDYINDNIVPIDSRLSFRGLGLLWGIDCSKINDSKLCKRIIDKCFEQRLIIENAGRNNTVLKIMPPLIIDEKILYKGLSILKEAIDMELRT